MLPPLGSPPGFPQANLALLTSICHLPHYSILVYSGLGLPTILSSSRAGIQSDVLLCPWAQVEGLAQSE